jgi:hypothetical protein
VFFENSSYGNVDDQTLLQSYLFIASKFQNKTARDVAYRLRWLKENEALLGRDALQAPVRPPARSTIPTPQDKPAPQVDSAQFGTILHLLEANEKLLTEISQNLQQQKLLENVAPMRKFVFNSTQIPQM